MRAMPPGLWESKAMSKTSRRRVFVDLSTLASDGSNGGSRVFVVRLLSRLLDGDDLDLHLLVKPAVEAAVASIVAKGATLHRLGRGLDVEEPRRPLRTRRRLPGTLGRLARVI